MEGNPEDWIVEYGPVIELHHAKFDSTSKKINELISKNCIHAGVVRANNFIRCKLSEIPLDQPLTVTIDDKQVEKVVFANLEINGIKGPMGTITWLKEKLMRSMIEGYYDYGVLRSGEGDQIKEGDYILTATPGTLIKLDKPC